MLLTTDTVVSYQLPGWPTGYAHIRVFTPTHHYQRPVIIVGEPLDNPGPPIMIAIEGVIALVRAEFLPHPHRAPRVLAYHPDPQGTGWFTTVAMRHWMPSRCLPWDRVISRAEAEQTTHCALVTPPATHYTIAQLRTSLRHSHSAGLPVRGNDVDTTPQRGTDTHRG